jgi:hypothetical protein
VVDNHIHHVGNIHWHAPGIFVWQSGHNQIAHNHVHHTPYTGIVVSGRIVWSRDATKECAATIRWDEIADAALPRDGERTPWRLREPYLHARHNVVEANDIHHCMQILGDGNAIYISGCGDANRVQYNYIHDIDTPRMNATIRCDDDQHGTIIHGNLITGVCGEGFIFKGANTMSNNVIYALRTTTPDGTPCKHQRGHWVLPHGNCAGSRLERNIFYAVEAGSTLLTEGRRHEDPAFFAAFEQVDADANIYFNSRDRAWGTSHLIAVQAHGNELHSLAVDPGFVDAAAGNFEFTPGSPAVALGIQSLSAANAGPRVGQSTG